MRTPLTSRSRVWLTLAFAALFVPWALLAGDEKQSPAHKAQKDRAHEPKPSDIDQAVTLEGLLDKKGPGDWSPAKAAVIEGHVVQIEREVDDGDYHVTLAPTGSETDTTRWVIVEVTPAWARKKASLSPAGLDALRSKTVRVTGWLFYEPEEPHPDPRGTRWEIHPVTDIVPVGK